MTDELVGAGPADTCRADLVRDWITIWQSELSAASTDRERPEGWAALVAAWADWCRMGATPPARPGPPSGAPPDGSAGRAAPQSPAGAAAADAAPDIRDAAIERLAARIDELERRLAGLGQPGGS